MTPTPPSGAAGQAPAADRAVALVSGGLDSCVTAALARGAGARLAFLHVTYGQRTQVRERHAFNDIADHYHVSERLVVDVDYLRQIGGSSLTDPALAIPHAGRESGGVPSTYVPFRNANLLAIAVAWAETMGAGAVYVGLHQEGSAYPDCRPAFVEAFNRMVVEGTRPGSAIQIRAPLLEMDKGQIVCLGHELRAPFHLTWSCYRREDRPCGTCHSCRLRQEGFAAAGLRDPLLAPQTTCSPREKP